MYDYGPFFGEIDVAVDTVDPDETDGGATADEEPGDPPEPTPDEPSDSTEPGEPDSFDGLVVYRVSTDQGFDELGRISTRFEEAADYWWTAFTRGVFISENVFAVTNQGVRGAPIDNIESAPYELVLPSSPAFDDTEPIGFDGSDSAAGSGG